MRVAFGTGDAQPFFDRCLASCSLGERSEFKLAASDPDFWSTLVWAEFDAFLEHPSELKSHPQDYHLKLELEVCSIKPKKVPQQPNVFELSTEQKRSIAENLKKEGDEHFKKQDFQKAVDSYTKAYKTIFFEDGEIFNELKFKIGSNLAFMNLKLKKYEECINMNDQFIRFGYDVTDKTFFRNGQAAESYGRFEEAIKFYEKAADATKDEEYRTSVLANIATVKKKISDKNSQVRRNMQKMWNS